jgi:S1-C subfamily serine protease
MNYLNRGDHEELKQSQRRWLRERLDCDDDFTCTKQAYRQRIERLSTILARVTDAGAPSESAYSVAGLALGGRVQFESKEYRKYDCKPSDQFNNFIWCHYKKAEHERRGSFQASYTILHSYDGTAVYIDRSQTPAYWSSNEVNEDIARYSKKLGSQPNVFREPSRPKLTEITIAIWGAANLTPLDDASRALLAEGKSPKKGIVVDTIANLTRSAREGLPLYRADGGAGFVWIASNKDGIGTLRFFAIDPSRFYPPQVATPFPPPPPLPSTPPPPVPPAPEENVFTGTGFFVAPGIVITNNHVVNECTKPIQVRPPKRASFTATLYGRDETNDLALLRTEMNNESTASFRIRFRLGERVAAYGFPYAGILSSSGNFTLGNVTAESGMKDDTRFLQISAPIQPGNSGGPLLDMAGSVVGVVVSQLNATRMMQLEGSIPQNVNFAIRAPIITNFLSVKGVSPKVTPGAALNQKLPEADVAEIAKQFTVQVYCKGVPRKTSSKSVGRPESAGWGPL